MIPSAAALSLALLLSSAACLHADTGSCPASCENVVCQVAESKVCVLQEVQCFSPPCHPVPVCIWNQCIATYCAVAGTRCVSVRTPGNQAACSPFPSCQISFKCQPRAQPKPGFCPPAGQVPPATGNQCDYDSDCASDLLCCPNGPGYRRCAAADCQNPCIGRQCPPQAPTCGMQGGQATCMDLACQPDTYFCVDNNQTYCTDAAVTVTTNLPC